MDHPSGNGQVALVVNTGTRSSCWHTIKNEFERTPESIHGPWPGASVLKWAPSVTCELKVGAGPSPEHITVRGVAANRDTEHRICT